MKLSLIVIICPFLLMPSCPFLLKLPFTFLI